MKQFQPFRKKWANCCHILFSWVHKKGGGLVSVADADEKWFSLFMHSYLWAVNVVDPNVLSLFSDTFHRWQIDSQRKPAVVLGWPELPDSHYWGSTKIHTLMWPVLTVLTRVKRRPSSALWLVSGAVNHWYHPITPLYVTRFLWCVEFQRLKVVL